jgi:acylphosphatase
MIGKRVVYSGRVQGVGFRYTTQRIASRFPVAGYVRNLPGGDVELAAEGEASDVEAFLDAVANQMAGYLERSTVHDEPVRGWTGFSIRH